MKSLLDAKVEEKRQLAEDRDRQLAEKEQQLVKEHELAKKVGVELCDIRAEAEGLRVALQASNQSRDEVSARAERLSEGEKELTKRMEELRAELASGSEKEAAMKKELEVVNASVDFLRQRSDVSEKERDQLQQKLVLSLFPTSASVSRAASMLRDVIGFWEQCLACCWSVVIKRANLEC